MTAEAPPVSPRAIALGIGGDLSLLAAATDKADYVVPVPFAVTVTKIKATLATATDALTGVQLRRSTGGGPFADVPGAAVTFAIGGTLVLGSVSPAVPLLEGDLLNLSVTNGGGANLLVELVGVAG